MEVSRDPSRPSFGFQAQGLDLEVGKVSYLAREIALTPCTRKLVSGRTQAETSMSLNHTLKILEATHGDTGPHHILEAHCYITGSKFIATALDSWPKNIRTHNKLSSIHWATVVVTNVRYGMIFQGSLTRAITDFIQTPEPLFVKKEEHKCHGNANDMGHILVVMVTFHLPREAVIEWHVIAGANEPFRRKHSTLKKIFEGFQDFRRPDNYVSTSKKTLKIAKPHPCVLEDSTKKTAFMTKYQRQCLPQEEKEKRYIENREVATFTHALGGLSSGFEIGS
ncbi:uncharacterized protein LOC113909209 [Zalophus californianus]|uniref:Uncharacterized protein LOC113909209 n=1 Tax=Zalophus californianus TaxID=9704 RepID=A0A6J2B2F6_ZALCA|nr:uncharacterized protein LOC113909209 [Zalophus californianus]